MPSKGAVHPGPVRALVSDVLASGYSRLILKSDQEPSMKELKRVAAATLRQDRGVDMILEESMAHSSESNGVVERAIWDVEAQIRVLKHAVEEAQCEVGNLTPHSGVGG